MITIEQVKNQLKEVLVRAVPKFSESVRDFNDEAPLRNSSFQLDSIDLLLLVLEIERKFGIRIVSHEFDEKVWMNLNSLAQAIQERMLLSQSSPTKVLD
jgi:acyl carrier protein